MSDKPWAAVQELLPFGYRIESQHATRLGAERRCIGSRYLTVMRTEDVRQKNKALEDRDTFMSALRSYRPRVPTFREGDILTAPTRDGGTAQVRITRVMPDGRFEASVD